MRSDILPKEYCLALETLRTDVTPMPLTEVERILTQAYARPWQEVFSDIGIRPLGSASIAQVHAATLTDGQRVVVKVQRPDLYEIMSRDVRLLKRAAVLLKYTPLASALDFHAVLDEIWRTVQEELDFTIEADNIAEFKRLNDGVAYADCPATFPEWCTKNVLVMQHIGGHQIDDAAGLRADGYDLNEIAVKLVHNYIRQITVYRFFHADPHPGNIRVQDGKIVWLDLGMMGRISPREAELYMGIIRTIYEQDVPVLTDTLLSLGQYTRMPDRQALTERIGIFLHKYEAMPMADMDMGVLVDEFVQILNEYGVSVPGSLTMLGRSLLVIQGMLTSVSPDANVIEIVAEYVKNTALSRELEAAEPAHLRAAGLLAAVLRGHHVPRPAAAGAGSAVAGAGVFRRRHRHDARALRPPPLDTLRHKYRKKTARPGGLFALIHLRGGAGTPETPCSRARCRHTPRRNHRCTTGRQCRAAPPRTTAADGSCRPGRAGGCAGGCARCFRPSSAASHRRRSRAA